MNLVYPSDYHLPGFYYFTSNNLFQIRKKQQKLLRLLKAQGFEEYHFPFLVPNELLEKYRTVISKENYIRVFSGKNKRVFYYMRPEAIFCQSLPLVSTLIKSYKDLPLKMLEASPAFKKVDLGEKIDLLNSPEESFAIQGAIFSENENSSVEKGILLLSREILKRFNINRFRTSRKNFGQAQYFEFYTKQNKRKIVLIKLFDLGNLICQRANIYYFNEKSQLIFPRMCSFSFSQNILLLGNINNGN